MRVQTGVSLEQLFYYSVLADFGDVRAAVVQPPKDVDLETQK